jgi:hypothetical protein
VTTLVDPGAGKIIVGGVDGACEGALDTRRTVLVAAAGVLVERVEPVVEGCVSSARLVYGEIHIYHLGNPPICVLDGVVSPGSNTSFADGRLGLSFGMA